MCAYRERASHDWSTDSEWRIATPSSFARAHLFYVQEIGHFHANSNYYTEREQLDSYLMVYTVSGVGELEYEGYHYSLKPHQLFFIHCMPYQFYKAMEHGPWEFVWTHINGGNVGGYYERFREASDNVITLPATSPVPDFMLQLLAEHRSNNVRTELQSSLIITELLTELLFTTRDMRLAGQGAPAIVATAVQLLEQGFNEKWSLNRLANLLSIDKFHLSKQFKQHIGYSPISYLIRVRIAFAKDKLKHTDMTIDEIAEAAGIEQTSHFIQLFKNREGCTPLAYRKSWKSQRH
ncbi:helix-turn-helix domain-containing protein [Paenibacillus sp. HB172176]|uniref:helix-turn-helix domain-containing protein n=1 Tax=Paenibacillus sp. HB172176 TaxID=2493690 RepID=UPI00143A7D1D|nr:helix-turn-helix domain-containing protein [Paenibacillus sp. HB172176]